MPMSESFWDWELEGSSKMKNKFFKTCSGSAFPRAFSHSPQKGPPFRRSTGSSGLAVGNLSLCLAEDAV